MNEMVLLSKEKETNMHTTYVKKSPENMRVAPGHSTLVAMLKEGLDNVTEHLREDPAAYEAYLALQERMREQCKEVRKRYRIVYVDSNGRPY